MKAFCISDNTDTLVGLRLAGIESVVVHEREEVIEKLKELINDKEIAIILVTTKIANLCPEIISKYKLELKDTLICEIPDRHLNSKIGETIDSYISEAIGLKI